jgi:hypothetical protein
LKGGFTVDKVTEIYDVIINTLPKVVRDLFDYELASLDNAEIAECLCDAIAANVKLN